MSFIDVLFGKPLATSDERAERIGASAGIPIFGLDALSSAAYGPEAALTLLIPLGGRRDCLRRAHQLQHLILLVIVYFSYLQTIAAYPGGGGSYTVARENLGANPRPAGRGGADYRLHPGGGRRHLGRCRRAGFRRAQPPAAHAGALSGHSGGDHARQSARRA